MQKWRKSSYSQSGSDCVEALVTPTTTGVRDSKAPATGQLRIARSEWTGFLGAIAAGQIAR
ncbi:MAG TPA: DUF397 domain-containing protein [Pseudonocardiaceae bacterium]|nr:DUF397 domain-containing protein [Pseudonocardiaceae bacterium]